jgi:adenylate cyclase
MQKPAARQYCASAAAPDAKYSGVYDTMVARSRGALLSALVAALLLSLPVAVWLDLRAVTESVLRRQASDLSSVISSIRGYYANHVVARVLASPGETTVLPNYEDVPGAIPIPATLSLELGRVISERQANISYRFVSDYPFANRLPHRLDPFETAALAALRENPKQGLVEVTGSLLTDRVRQVAPVLMEAPCVACHNTHPDSPKRDWKIGDVRGIQEVLVTQPIVPNIFSLRYLLLYLGFAGASGVTFIALQWRQTSAIAAMNRELEAKNALLHGASKKLSRYLSPQICESLFKGETDTDARTQRKKLTIFFSDIQDFTGATQRLQPEDMAALLNEYLTEMSTIALAHGGTIDKFIGDGLLIFFGDPETKGAAEDARACLAMAVSMWRRLAELNAKWRREGLDRSLRVRMGINTGFVSVGNFGSPDRMDYTVIGAEVNVAARLQALAEPGQVVMSYETYALVRDVVAARPLPPIPAAEMGRDVVPYAVDRWLDANGTSERTFDEHLLGLDFYLDPRLLDRSTAGRVRELLRSAVADLEKEAPGAPDLDNPSLKERSSRP